MNRRLTSAAVAVSAAVLLTGCASGANTVDANWSEPSNPEVAATQAGTITTYALPDTWANYGALLEGYCESIEAECEHVDTDMSSSEAIQRYDAEQGNPVGYFSDIGGLWGPVAEDVGVTAPYVPEGATDLEPGQYAEDGGWVNTFTGVMGFLVNPAVVEEAPTSWDALLQDTYADGKVASAALTAPSSGSAQAAILSIALARGGSIDNLDAAWKYLNELYATGNISDAPPSVEALIRGEYGVMLQYDFNAVAMIEEAAAQGVELEFYVPQDGSIYMPSSILANGHNDEDMEFIKGFLDYVLSDEGQLLFADFGARPIRYVNGDLEVPEERRERWLPEELYANTQTIDPSAIDPEQLISEFESDVNL
ncbi:MAG: extracellular solute-binding protein [Micrococcus sp.]|nr:extracellular solute-binding protein [Micrococcus sp.]